MGVFVGAALGCEANLLADEVPYRQFADDFLADHYAWRPLSGTSLGLHEYDAKAPNFSAASI